LPGKNQFNLLQAIYQLTRTFPNEEKFGLSKLLDLISEISWQQSNNKLEKISALVKGLRKSIENRMPGKT